MAESFKMSKGQTQSASIGCGSLILVGFVVLFVTGSMVNPLKQQFSELQIEVAQQKEAIEALSNRVRALEDSVSKLKPPAPVEVKAPGSL